jgi:exopolysaccharide biosynthesis polyprenyl glycosylphosphotransferase
MLYVDHPGLRGVRRVAKATLDRVTAAAALLVMLPLLVVLFVLIRATSEGPALFRQQRVGSQGRVFTIYKLRTMYVDAEERLADLVHRNDADGLLFKIRDDPRVTGLGRWLRRLSIDEAPQLLNVVRGEMSLVGPRPPLPCEVDAYTGDIMRRLMVKPGLTGLWQVSGRSDLSWEQSVRLDLYYVENWSLGLDISILLRTIFAVVVRKGAY